MQDWPQIEETSLTQSESHVLLQQNESCAQIWPAHESHVGVSLTPAAQTGCAHAPPPQVSWQTDWTSPTQTLSQEVLQQKASCAQIWAAHGSHDEVRRPPVEQIG